MNEHESKPVDSIAPIQLRVAVLLDGEQQPAWIHAMLEKAKSLSFVSICLVITRTGDTWKNGSSPLWKLYRYADDRLFGRVADALAVRDISGLLRDVPRLEAGSVENQIAHSDHHDIDVVMDISRDFAPESLAGFARYGVWRHEFDDMPLRDPTVVGRREVFDAAPLTLSSLVGHLSDGQLVCLYRSQSRTVPFSPRRNRDNVYWKSATYASRALTALHQSRSIPNDLVSPSNSNEMRHTNFNMAAALARASGNLLGRAMQKTKYVDQWFIAFKFEAEPALPHTLSGFQSLMPPKDRFWADPFPIERDGRYFIFIEELPFATNKGHISVMEVWPDGRWTKPVKVLEQHYHLSYPSLFEWRGALYMLPETGQNRTVEVYRCHRFPDDWRLEKVLLENVRSADATLANIDDHWWMFVNIGEDGTELYDELHLYHADQPFGKWTPHCNNPVKSDALSARPAGNLLQWQGEIYRPAQVCAPLYGTAISFNKIEQLDPEHFVEREIARFDPIELLGCHTYNRSGNLTVIDGFKRIPRFSG